MTDAERIAKLGALALEILEAYKQEAVAMVYERSTNREQDLQLIARYVADYRNEIDALMKSDT
jgi:DNA-binding ferritin-like protein